MAPLVEKEVTEKEKDEESPPAASEAATVTAEQTVAPPTESSSNEQSGNTKEKEKIGKEMMKKYQTCSLNKCKRYMTSLIIYSNTIFIDIYLVILHIIKFL